jgi:hypothetical protein
MFCCGQSCATVTGMTPKIESATEMSIGKSLFIVPSRIAGWYSVSPASLPTPAQRTGHTKHSTCCLVRFGSKADMGGAIRHVRFAPNSDRESGLVQKFMSALTLKADVCSALANVCYGRRAGINLCLQKCCDYQNS